ncbi:MAG: hypothetical protein R3D44_09700 [Hyphomicrobiaceae bacterium]
MSTDKSEHELLAEALGRLGTRLSACCADAGREMSSADAMASALSRHITGLKPNELPTAARTIWADRVARPLKASAHKPLSQRSIAMVRSWPSARVEQLAAALAAIAEAVEEAEIDARNEIVRAAISREYS